MSIGALEDDQNVDRKEKNPKFRQVRKWVGRAMKQNEEKWYGHENFSEGR